jgi:hypothetical protein
MRGFIKAFLQVAAIVADLDRADRSPHVWGKPNFRAHWSAAPLKLLDYPPRDRKTVDILDLMHVNPRPWEAAHLFHPEGSDEATQFVRTRMLRVLQGKAKAVIADLRQVGAEHGLRGARTARLRKLCKFLDKNLRRMRYDKYLRAGYPIATGVIEGIIGLTAFAAMMIATNVFNNALVVDLDEYLYEYRKAPPSSV